MRTSAVATTLFAAGALAAPLTARDPPNSPYPVEANQDVFSLVARVVKQRTVGSPLEIDNFVLTSAHVGAGEDQSLLVSASTTKSASNPFGIAGETYVQNGTAQDIIYGNGYVERYPPQSTQLGGTYGIRVIENNVADDAAGHSVFTYVGTGSRGVGVRYPYTGIAFPENQPILGYTNTTDTTRTYGSQFYACEGQLYGDSVIEVFWHSENTTTPDSCTDIVLFAQCAGNATEELKPAYHTVQKTPCYADASKIPYVGNN